MFVLPSISPVQRASGSVHSCLPCTKCCVERSSCSPYMGMQGFAAKPKHFAKVCEPITARATLCVRTQGFAMLPKHCAEMMIAFFLLALVMSLVRDLVPTKYSVFIPVPMAMAIPFYVGANVALDISIGALVKAYWYWTSPETAPGKVRGPLRHTYPASLPMLALSFFRWHGPQAPGCPHARCLPICLSHTRECTACMALLLELL